MTDVSVTVGDVIHFSDEARSGVLVTDEPEPTAPTIAQLLSQSRAAHLKFRQSDGHINREGKVAQQPNYSAAEAAIREALNARLAAQAADPHHADPAWAEDQAANKGISSQAMLDFFRDYLV